MYVYNRDSRYFLDNICNCGGKFSTTHLMVNYMKNIFNKGRVEVMVKNHSSHDDGIIISFDGGRTTWTYDSNFINAFFRFNNRKKRDIII